MTIVFLLWAACTPHEAARSDSGSATDPGPGTARLAEAAPSPALVGSAGEVLVPSTRTGFWAVSHDLAGDLDGDGFDELAAGAYLDSDGGSSAGAVMVYPGARGGLDAATEQKLLEPTPGADRGFGYAVSTRGDGNGDGYDDLAVSAPGADSGCGVIYVFGGSSAGVSAGSWTALDHSGCSTHRNMGASLSWLGDVDGDGYDDLGTILSLNGDSFTGAHRIRVYAGSATGLDTARFQELSSYADDYWNNGFGAIPLGLTGGDFDGDGHADLAVGVSNATPDSSDLGDGLVRVHLGSASGLSTSWSTLVAPSGAEDFGYAVASGDFDGDGFDDLVVGAPGSTGGMVVLFAGSASGLSTTGSSLAPASLVDLDWFGGAVATGDIDGDGFDDLIVGASGDSDVADQAGATWVFFGSATGIDADSAEKITEAGTAASSRQGGAVGAGDVDGDGTADISSVAIFAGQLHVYRRDADDDGLTWDQDCDDADSAVGVGTTLYIDADLDGLGDPAATGIGCPGAPGFADNAMDCDDGDATAPIDGGTWRDCGAGSGPAVTFSGSWSFPASASIGVQTTSGATIVSVANASGGTGATKSVTTTAAPAFTTTNVRKSGKDMRGTVQGVLHGCVVDEPRTTVTTAPTPVAACTGQTFRMLFLQDVDTNRYARWDAPSFTLDYAGTRVSTLLAPGTTSAAVGDVDLAFAWTSERFRLDTVDADVDVPSTVTITYGGLTHSDVTTYEDSDGDLLPDLDEVELHGTDPDDADSDGDGASDGVEIEAGTDPLDASDTVDPDADGDGLDLLVESILGTDPDDADSDDDGVEDLDEVGDGTDPGDASDSTFTDSDGDGIDDRYQDDGGDSGSADGDGGGDTGTAPKDEGCNNGCATAHPAGGAGLGVALLSLVGLRRRRR